LLARRDRGHTRRGTLALADEQRRDTESADRSARRLPRQDLAQPIAELERRRGDLFAADESGSPRRKTR
jgi:hypothetical protein